MLLADCISLQYEIGCPFLYKLLDATFWNQQAASSFEAVRDITVASHLIGDMSGSTLDDPLSDCYEKLACSISALEKDSDDYKMIVNYLEKTYEPVKLGDIVRMTLLYAIIPTI